MRETHQCIRDACFVDVTVPFPRCTFSRHRNFDILNHEPFGVEPWITQARNHPTGGFLGVLKNPLKPKSHIFAITW